MTPPFSISQISTLHASFDEDLRAYVAAGVDGIGLWELKLPEDDGAAAEALRRSGLRATNAVPLIPSVLPLPLMEGPSDPNERIDAICASVRRLARFQPDCCVCLTGPGDDRPTVVEGLRRIAAAAAEAGVRVGLEPIQRDGAENWTCVSSIAEGVDLLEEVDEPTLGVMFDTWHVWNTPTLLEDIAHHCDRFTGVHVADWRSHSRGWADRVLPGEGVAPLAEILAALESAGWRGAYDLEIFSDDGAFGDAYPDSLWKLDAVELARRGRESFLRVWNARKPIDRPPRSVLQ